MAWQKCPVCNGTGKNYGNLLEGIYSSNCPTCNGHRIINEATGLAPSIVNIKSSDTTELDLNQSKRIKIRKQNIQ